MVDYSKLPQVAHLLDEYTFVINQGEEAGVKLGDNYLIFRLGDNVSDPATGDDLGTLEVVVGRAQVAYVQEKISTLKSSMKEVVPGKTRRIIHRGGLGSAVFPTKEEVEEGREVHNIAINAQVGDYARPV